MGGKDSGAHAAHLQLSPRADPADPAARRDGSPPPCTDPYAARLSLNTSSKQTAPAVKKAFSQEYIQQTVPLD